MLTSFGAMDARVGVLLQISGVGPSGTHYTEAKDDPRAAAK